MIAQPAAVGRQLDIDHHFILIPLSAHSAPQRRRGQRGPGRFSRVDADDTPRVNCDSAESTQVLPHRLHNSRLRAVGAESDRPSASEHGHALDEVGDLTGIERSVRRIYQGKRANTASAVPRVSCGRSGRIVSLEFAVVSGARCVSARVPRKSRSLTTIRRFRTGLGPDIVAVVEVMPDWEKPVGWMTLGALQQSRKKSRT